MYWHRSNHEIIQTLLTECHTVDYAHAKLTYFKSEREDFIAYTLANNKRTLAEVVQADLIANDARDTRQHRLQAEYALEEAKALHPGNQRRIEYARRELAFIDYLLERIANHRLYDHLDPFAAEQLAVRDNNLVGLMLNAYYDLVAIGVISNDRFRDAHTFGNKHSMLMRMFQELTHHKANNPKFHKLSKSEVFSLVRFEHLGVKCNALDAVLTYDLIPDYKPALGVDES